MSKIGAYILLFVIILGGIFTYRAGTWVGNSEIGIVKHMNGTITTINAGWNWTGYGVSVSVLPTAVQPLILSNDKNEGGGEDQSWNVSTKDGQKLQVNTNLLWQINPADAISLYKAVGGNDIYYIRDQIVRVQLKNVVDKITPQYNWTDLYGAQKTDVTNLINQELALDLAKFGLELPNQNSFGFSNIEPPKGMADAQAQLATAELSKQKAQADQNTQQIANQTKIMNADADAQAMIKEAEGTRAQAGALNEFKVQEDYLNKWDGKLPTVSAGGSGSILNIPAVTASK